MQNGTGCYSSVVFKSLLFVYIRTTEGTYSTWTVVMHYGSNLLDLIFEGFLNCFQLKLHCATLVLTPHWETQRNEVLLFRRVCFGYLQSWIFPLGLGLLRTRGSWTRWPPGPFQLKLFSDSNYLLVVFNTTALCPWFELVSNFLIHTSSLNMFSWNKKNLLRLTEFICKSCCRKSCLIPYFSNAILLWHTLKLQNVTEMLLPPEHTWNVCEYFGFWFHYYLKPNC